MLHWLLDFYYAAEVSLFSKLINTSTFACSLSKSKGKYWLEHVIYVRSSLIFIFLVFLHVLMVKTYHYVLIWKPIGTFSFSDSIWRLMHMKFASFFFFFLPYLIAKGLHVSLHCSLFCPCSRELKEGREQQRAADRLTGLQSDSNGIRQRCRREEEFPTWAKR